MWHTALSQRARYFLLYPGEVWDPDALVQCPISQQSAHLPESLPFLWVLAPPYLESTGTPFPDSQTLLLPYICCSLVALCPEASGTGLPLGS